MVPWHVGLASQWHGKAVLAAMICQVHWTIRCFCLCLGDTHELAAEAVKDLETSRGTFVVMVLIHYFLGAAHHVSVMTKLQLTSAISMTVAVHSIIVSLELEEPKASTYRITALWSQLLLPFTCFIVGATQTVAVQCMANLFHRRRAAAHDEDVACASRISWSAQSAAIFAGSLCALFAAVLVGGPATPANQASQNPFPLFFGAVALWLLCIALGVASGVLSTNAVPRLWFATAAVYPLVLATVIGVLDWPVDEIFTFASHRYLKGGNSYLQSGLQFVLGGITATMPRTLQWKLTVVAFWVFGSLLVATVLTHRLQESRSFLFTLGVNRVRAFVEGFCATEGGTFLLKRIAPQAVRRVVAPQRYQAVRRR